MGRDAAIITAVLSWGAYERMQSPTLSSASNGRCKRISIGSVSAAITTTSLMPLFSVLVAAIQEKRSGHAVFLGSTSGVPGQPHLYT
jgi:hypothetical protein